MNQSAKDKDMNYDDELFTPEGNQPVDSGFRPDPSSVNQQKSGCGMKAFLIFLAALGGLTLLCCCGIGISIYSMVPEIEENPAIAKQNLSRMITIDLLEGFEAKSSFKMNMFSLISMDGVLVENPESGAIIFLEFSGSLAENKEMQDSFREAIGSGKSNDDINIQEQQSREVAIDGQKFKFNFIQGTQKNSNEQVRQVHGVLPGKEGPILFIMNVSEEKWDEEQTLKMLESIKLSVLIEI